MSNTISTQLNDKIVAQEGFQAFKQALAPFGAFSVSYGSDPSIKGGSVAVPLISAMTAGSFAGDYETGDTTLSDVSVNLSNHFFRSFHTTDVEVDKTSVNAPAMQAREAAYAVAKLCLDTGFGLVTDVNYANEYVAGSTFDTDAIANVALSADTLNWSETNRTLILGNTAINDLRKDDVIKSVATLGADTIRSGVLPTLSGFQIYRCPAVPGVGIAAHPSGMAVAARPLRPQGDIDFEVVTDPDSGLSLGFRSWYSPKTGCKWHCFEILFGAVKAKTDGLIRIVTQESSSSSSSESSGS